MSVPEQPVTAELDPIASFYEYGLAQKARINSIDWLLRQGIPIVTDTVEVNRLLSTAGRSDMAITEPAPMMPLSTPPEIFKSANNFTPGFRMGHVVKTGEVDDFNRPVRQEVPATAEDVLALRELPKIESFEQAQELRESGRFSAFYAFGSHASKPTFLRTLLLFPDFTSKFVASISSPENRHRYERFDLELFAAYQFMSRLVDKGDNRVTVEGEVDDWYLCH
jgi:hypothetical protein